MDNSLPAAIPTERPLGTRCCVPDGDARLDTAAAQQLSDDFQIMAHPVRLQILDLLARRQGQVCVCDLEAALPVKQPTVSHHLKLLREAGLIGSERHGQWMYYFIHAPTLAAVRARITVQLEALG